jgi:hypothetical protein
MLFADVHVASVQIPRSLETHASVAHGLLHGYGLPAHAFRDQESRCGQNDSYHYARQCKDLV